MYEEGGRNERMGELRRWRKAKGGVLMTNVSRTIREMKWKEMKREGKVDVMFL